MAKKTAATDRTDYCVDGTLAHRWRLQEADGPFTMGRCRRCKRQRQFRASDPENFALADQKRKGQRAAQVAKAKRGRERARETVRA